LKSQEKLEHEVGDCLRAGDIDGAAARVLQRCGPGVLGYLRVAVGDDKLAQDAFESFSNAVSERLRRPTAEHPVRVWVYQLAYRCAKEQRDSIQARRTRTQQTGVPRAKAKLRTATHGLGAVADADMLRRELTVQEQTLLTLRIDRQFDWLELGHVLGVRSDVEQTARRRYERLVRRLHRLAVTRGLVAPGPVPASVSALQLVRRG
jgi:RNA polymerase sigma-70 factor (ECF subfamily)